MAWIQHKPRERAGPVILGLTLMGCLPQFEALTNFGNLTWMTSYVFTATLLGCVFGVWHVFAVVSIARNFLHAPVVSVVSLLLIAGNAFVSWKAQIEIMEIMREMPPGFYWETLHLRDFWTLGGFVEMLIIFVGVPVLIYLGVRRAIRHIAFPDRGKFDGGVGNPAPPI